MRKKIKNNNILKIGTIFGLIFVFAISTVSAIILTNPISFENKLPNQIIKTSQVPELSLLETGIWEDPFDDDSLIDLFPPGAGVSDNFVVSDGVVSLVGTYPAWSDVSWTKMKPVTLNYPGFPLYDYALKLVVEYDSDMQSDFGDLRFKHEGSPDVWCDYWVEFFNSSCAIVWVEVPVIPSGSSVLFMFYGNPYVSSASDFDSVFVWGDTWSGDERFTYHLDNEGTWDPDVCFGSNDFFVFWFRMRYFWNSLK
jgi:hypothetical protein